MPDKSSMSVAADFVIGRRFSAAVWLSVSAYLHFRSRFYNSREQHLEPLKGFGSAYQKIHFCQPIGHLRDERYLSV